MDAGFLIPKSENTMRSKELSTILKWLGGTMIFGIGLTIAWSCLLGIALAAIGMLIVLAVISLLLSALEMT